MTLLFLFNFASDSGLSAKDIGMIIGIILGPMGVGGIMKWIDKGKDDRLGAKDEQIEEYRAALKSKDGEILAIKEEAHERNRELIAELRTTLPKLEETTLAIKESTETMKKVTDWMESSSRLTEEEIRVMKDLQDALRLSRETSVALAAKYDLTLG